MRKVISGSVVAIWVAFAASAHATLVFSETFAYADGALTTVSGGTWVNHSGTTLQVDVTSGVVNLTGSEAEDVNRAFAAIASGNAYAGFDLTLTTLPTSTTTYFAHFSDGGTSNFRGKIFSTLTGAASGSYRLGISNVSNTINATVPLDLSLTTTYRVVVRTDVTTMTSTLFINSATETGGTSAADSATATGISAFALRQSSGIGVMSLDNLLVATDYANAYAAAVPEASAFLFGGLACCAAGAPYVSRRLRRRKAAA